MTENYERYGNREEAKICEKEQKLVLKPNHENQSKWISEVGKVDPRRLGKRKNYDYQMKIVAKNGTNKWLKQFEVKPENEPGRYAISPSELSRFNDEYVVSIEIKKRRS
jgi:hypothetical protein